MFPCMYPTKKTGDHNVISGSLLKQRTWNHKPVNHTVAVFMLIYLMVYHDKQVKSLRKSRTVQIANIQLFKRHFNPIKSSQLHMWWHSIQLSPSHQILWTIFRKESRHCWTSHIVNIDAGSLVSMISLLRLELPMLLRHKWTRPFIYTIDISLFQ